MVKILDCTTRDGGHNTNWNFDTEFIQDFVKCQNKTGISFYEIGYRNHIDKENKGGFYYCTNDFFKKFSNINNIPKIGVMVDSKRYNEKDFPDSKNDFADFVRVACHPNAIQNTFFILNELTQRGYNIFLQLMEISDYTDKEFLILKHWKDKSTLKSLYIADSYGILKPNNVKFYFEKLRDIGYENISFHAHNKNNMALENTLTAIDCGAYSIDITFNGIGRNGGNLDGELLLKNLSEFDESYYRKLGEKYNFIQ